MDFELSSHARKRIRQRKIKLDWIKMAINNPDTIDYDKEDVTVLHVLKDIPEKHFKTLRVIYNETSEPVIVVTAYFE